MITFCDDSKTASAGKINPLKNRYPNVYPYDFNRVRLQKDCGDYINASRIDIGDGKSVIACQGPLLQTVHDFWSMVLNERITTIIMLTPLEENGYAKCAKYWPSDLGEMTVTCSTPYCLGCREIKIINTSILEYPSVKISIFTVKSNDEILFVRHIHYMSWKDTTLPETHTFSFLLENLRLSPKAVVHCSAGVSRTGLFLCAARAINTGETYSAALRNIASQRIVMQTSSQIDFVENYLTR